MRPGVLLRPPAAPTLAVFDFTALAFGAVSLAGLGLALARASTATVQTSASSLVSGLANDVPKAGSDGTHAGLDLEESRINRVFNSRDPSGTHWALGSGVTVAAVSATAPDGAATSVRCQAASGVVAAQQTPSIPAAGAYAVSAWHRQGSAGASWQYLLAASTGTVSPTAAQAGVGTAAWQRTVGIATATAAGNAQVFIGDGRSQAGNGGVAAGARDLLSDLHQVEDGGFATNAIITTAGATATRAGEHLSTAATAAALVSGTGRLSLSVKLQPKGASTAYANNMRLFTIDANNYAEVDAATHAVRVVRGGTSYVTPVAMSWAAGDTLELSVEAGGGTLATRVEYRVNAGTATTLSTGSPPVQDAFGGTGAVDLLCAGTANQFTAWVQNVTFWNAGQHAAWVV